MSENQEDLSLFGEKKKSGFISVFNDESFPLLIDTEDSEKAIEKTILACQKRLTGATIYRYSDGSKVYTVSHLSYLEKHKR